MHACGRRQMQNIQRPVTLIVNVTRPHGTLNTLQKLRPLNHLGGSVAEVGRAGWLEGVCRQLGWQLSKQQLQLSPGKAASFQPSLSSSDCRLVPVFSSGVFLLRRSGRRREKPKGLRRRNHAQRIKEPMRCRSQTT